MRFLSDMGISPKTVTFLQNFGYDAIHLHEMGLDKLPDSDILEKSVNEGSILLTHDLDFGELLSRSGAKMPSVIIFRLRNMSPTQRMHISYLQCGYSMHRLHAAEPTLKKYIVLTTP